MPFFQRLVLPFFRFEYSNNFLPIGIQIFEWTENCDPLIHSAEKKCKTKINNRKVTKFPTAKLIEIAVANCKHGHNFIEILHVSCTCIANIFRLKNMYTKVHHWSLLSGIHTESAIAGYWLGSVMNHNRSEGKFLWFPPTNPSQENGKSPKFSNNHYKMSKTLHILKHVLIFFNLFSSFIDVISCRCRSQCMPLALQCVLHWVERSELRLSWAVCELFFFFFFFLVAFWGDFFFEVGKKMCRSPPSFEFAALFFSICAFSWMALVPFCLAKVPFEV